MVHALAVVLRMLDDKMPAAEALSRLGRHSHLPMPLQTALLLLLQVRRVPHLEIGLQLQACRVEAGKELV